MATACAVKLVPLVAFKKGGEGGRLIWESKQAGTFFAGEKEGGAVACFALPSLF